MKIYNSLTQKKEEFIPIQEGKVSMYNCGPTVYDYIHIGNLRSFFMADIIRRTFEYLDYELTQVMNITDVGHLVSDGDEGNDKMTKALKRHGMDINLENMLKIADFYAEAFKEDLKNFNILQPHHMPKASQHIQEDIFIIQQLEKKGYTYTTSDGVYFDTQKMKDYGKLGGLNLDEETQSRIGIDDEKKFHADFALWKFDEHHGWDSPWGHGFPGWHIECSGMSMKYLGETIDIHTGGHDLKSVHHNNEIAQSECSTEKTFVHYWIHGEFLNIGGDKLSKSKSGNITLKTVQEKGFHPLDLRYLYLQSHYRSPMNFDWDILQGAHNSLHKIYKHIAQLKEKHTPGKVDQNHKDEFTQFITDDFNTPGALAVFHTMLKSDISDEDKLATAYDFDRIFGLRLNEYTEEKVDIPQEIIELLKERKKARDNKDWETSDKIRDIIREKGFQVSDIDGEQKVEKI